MKLQQQFSSGAGGGERVSDTVGAGSKEFGKDGRAANGGWEPGAAAFREGGQKSLWESLQGAQVEKNFERPKKRIKTEKEMPRPTRVVNPFTQFGNEDGSVKESSRTSHESSPSPLLSPIDPNNVLRVDKHREDEEDLDPICQKYPQIFANLGFYINGSTAPAISDHKLKHMISCHGGRVSVAVGRRTVTHVIIGRPASNGGSGGGLAGSKIQKEVARMRGENVKFVTVEWVIESVGAGKRLSEWRFEALRLAPQGSGTIVSMFEKDRKVPAKRDGKG